MKEELPIVAPDGYEIDKERMVFVPKEIDLFPDESWCVNNDFQEGSKKVGSKTYSSEFTNKVFSFAKLIELRDEVNRRDGFVVDWESEYQPKYCLFMNGKQKSIGCRYVGQRVFAFRTREIGEQFSNKYQHLIDQCSDLM